MFIISFCLYSPTFDKTYQRHKWRVSIFVISWTIMIVVNVTVTFVLMHQFHKIRAMYFGHIEKYMYGWPGLHYICIRIWAYWCDISLIIRPRPSSRFECHFNGSSFTQEIHNCHHKTHPLYHHISVKCTHLYTRVISANFPANRMTALFTALDMHRVYRSIISQNVDKPKCQPNVEKLKRRQTKTSTYQNVDKPNRRQTKTSTTETLKNRNVDKPERR